MTSRYLLGHDEREHERLAHQHALWRNTLLPALREHGAKPGGRVLEVGAGSGVLLADIAGLVEPGGTAEGLERDPDAVKKARRSLGDRALVREGDLTDAPLGGPWDVVVARWVLSFVPDPGAAIARMVEALAPRGAVVIQDYNHEGLASWPREPALVEAIEALRRAYKATGGDLFVAPKIPGMMQRAGLRVDRIEPHVMASGPDGGAFQWVERFFLEHLDNWVRGGHLAPEIGAECRLAWARLRARPDSVLFTPMVVTVVGTRV